MELGIHEHSRRCELAEGNAVGLALWTEFAGRSSRQFRPTGPPIRNGPTQCRRLFAVRCPDRQMKRLNRRRLLGINLVLPVHRLKKVGKTADGLRCAQQQEPSGLERKMKRGHRFLLRARLEIDQHVAATDEVYARERRVGGEVLPREDHHIAHRLIDTVAAVRLDKEPLQALWGEIGDEALRVQTTAGLLQHRFAEVGGEDFELA